MNLVKIDTNVHMGVVAMESSRDGQHMAIKTEAGDVPIASLLSGRLGQIVRVEITVYSLEEQGDAE